MLHNIKSKADGQAKDAYPLKINWKNWNLEDLEQLEQLE